MQAQICTTKQSQNLDMGEERLAKALSCALQVLQATCDVSYASLIYMLLRIEITGRRKKGTLPFYFIAKPAASRIVSLYTGGVIHRGTAACNEISSLERV